MRQPPLGSSRGALAFARCALPALAPLRRHRACGAVARRTRCGRTSRRFVLPEVIANTIKLVLGVALSAACSGTVLAWLTAMCEFPGRRFFDWALLLPLAMPAYVLAFVAVGFLDYSGPLQSWLRDVFGTSAWFPRDSLARRRRARHLACNLSLRLFARAQRLHDARTARAGSGANTGTEHSPRRLGVSRCRWLARGSSPASR